MINFNKLDREELSTNGFAFETQEEADLFAEVIREELEIRIGEAITRKVGEEKAKEFDLCSPEKAREWLDKNCPEHRDIVREKRDELAREMEKYKSRIPGLVQSGDNEETLKTGKQANERDDTPIEQLDLSVRSYNCLKRAGLCTIGDVMAYGDLSKIRNLGRKCVEEIKAKIWEAVNLPAPLTSEKAPENTDEMDEELIGIGSFDPDELLDDFLEED